MLKNKSLSNNPFIAPYNTPFNIPPFEKIEAGHFLPAIHEGIRCQQEEIETIVSDTRPPDFENTVEALENSGQLFWEVKTVFEMIRAAHTGKQLQSIEQEAQRLFTQHGDDILHHWPLFERVKHIYEKRDSLDLTEEQTTLLEQYYKDFLRGGADMTEEEQIRLREINARLTQLAVMFENNVLEETNSFLLIIDKPEDLEGLSKGTIHVAEVAAEKNGLPGKWVFSLHQSSVISFLSYAKNRQLREKIFNAYINRGNNNNAHDNKSILVEMLQLRTEKAKLLGYEDYAEYVLEKSMAHHTSDVYHLLERLWPTSLAIASHEADALQGLIDREHGGFKLQPWDWWYYAERLRKKLYNVNEQMIRRYLSLEHVKEGAFYVAEKLFGLRFIRREDMPKYHKNVETYEVREADGRHVGVLYFDFFPRAGKQIGAWMCPIRKQARVKGSFVAPVIVNNMNFHKPSKQRPSLLSLEEAKTLFHEFGHALHGLLSDCHYRRLSGTATPPDFVELPSQLMENWAIEPEILKVYARHYQTGEVIPDPLIEKIHQARYFNRGFTNVEYIAAAYLDLHWHSGFPVKAKEVNRQEAKLLKSIGLIPEIAVRYKSTNFVHIFGGGYAAEYYSYIWAEVLDADAFAAFQETSLFDATTAGAFRTHILEKGGSVDPQVLYRRFRGKEPSLEPLLKRYGFYQHLKWQSTVPRKKRVPKGLRLKRHDGDA